MVKFSAIAFSTAVFVRIIPALASDVPTVEYESRSLEALSEDTITSREFIEAVYGRELTEVELQEREPFFPLIFAAARIGAQVASRVGSRVASKAARKGIKKGAEHHHNQRQNRKHKRSLNSEDDIDLSARDALEDIIEERDVFDVDDEFEAREIDELD